MIQLFNGLKVNYVNMSSLTTFRIGGKVLIIYVDSLIELDKSIIICKTNDIKYYIIGNGSKLLCDDNLDDIVIVKLSKKLNYIKVRNNTICCGGAALTSTVANIAKQYSLGGAEFLKCLPATVGGAVIMNAGCFGQECSQIVSRVWASNGNRHICIDNANINFNYRECKLKGTNWVIYKVELVLCHKESGQIEELTNRMLTSKRQTQPLSSNSCGSIFKRNGDIIPAVLIQELGLKGFRVGDAQVSELHSNFIINIKNATAKEVKELIDIIKRQIYNRFNIELTEEVIYIRGINDSR